MENKKIGNAKHNVVALALEDANGKISIEHDDDGEKGAGARLAAFLSAKKVKNVVIIVTRWFGGINIGSNRFKCYSNAAASALNKFQ